MNNCLITKLKGVVDNDELMKFGEYRFKISNVTNETNCQLIGNNITVSFDVPVTINGQEVTSFTGSNFLFYTNQNVNVSVQTKYTLRNIAPSAPSNSFSLELDSLKYASTFETLNTLSPSNVTYNGDVDELFKSTTVCIMAKSLNVTGKKDFSLSEINANSPHLGYFELSTETNLNITGSITDICNLTELKRFGFGNVNLTGDKELTHLLNLMVSVGGKTSGETLIRCNPDVTYDGVAQGYVDKTFKFGTSMINPTQEDLNRGWQLV